MVKKIAIVVSLSIILQVRAMNPICYLVHMNLDIQNLIALFLICADETEQEFIARTKRKKKLPCPEYDQFLLAEKNVFRKPQMLGISNETLRVFSPDKTKIALLRLPCNSTEGFHPILIIIDRQKNEPLLVDEKFDMGHYKHIALSRNAGMLATVERRKCIKNSSQLPSGPVIYQRFLVIKNLAMQKKHELSIFPGEFSISSINFNKQGTHIVAHYAEDDCYFNKICALNPLIFPLKIEKKKADVLIDRDLTNTTPLQRCLRERRICKSLENSK